MSPKPQIYCPNPNCVAPLNPLGSSTCASCQTPLTYRYLWAVGNLAEQTPAGAQVAGRYYVTAPRVWLDTQPGLPPDTSPDWPDDVAPYLHLYPHRLHIPEVYGFCPAIENYPPNSILLLDNVPLDATGTFYPAITQAWSQAGAVRQVYWLWQILQLWTPLMEHGVAASLLVPENLRIEGWRVRLCQLFRDADILTAPGQDSDQGLSGLGLMDLGNVWLGWVDQAQPSVVTPLRVICQQLQSEAVKPGDIAARLNQLLLETAAQLPLDLEIVGVTDTGPQRSHNEDASYPITLGGKAEPDGFMGRLAIVCDGIGGHEGGEVASQMAVRSLKLQVQALLAEIAEQPELQQPDLVGQQLEAIVRVVNNLIASQNDLQGREDRRRMGTTLVMALQLPQQITAADDRELDNSHELYLVHVGDSRAYWITPHYCQQLTVDDDVAAREVKMGRSLYREALKRSDAGALTQAIGTRDAEFLHPTIQRFVLEENGLLLLCSDGLSDNGLVEQSWARYAEGVFNGKLSLESAAKAWLELANQRNGYDNTSIVLLHCQVSPPQPSLDPLQESEIYAGSDWSPASRALLDDDSQPEQPEQPSPVATQGKRDRKMLTVISVLLLLLLGSGLALVVWSRVNPDSFQQLRQRIAPSQPSPNS